MSRNGNEEVRSGTGENWWEEWRPIYPTFSAWFRDLEQCPEVRRMWAKTPQIESQLQMWLDQWIARGRPELAWPESASTNEGHQSGHKLQKQNHQEES